MTVELIQKAVADVANVQKANAEAVRQSFEKIDTQQRELADRLVVLEQKGIALPVGGREGSVAPSLVRKFMESEQLRAVLGGAPSTGRFEVKASLTEVRKALLSYQGAEVNTNQYNVQAQRAPGVYADPRRVFTLLDVLPTVQATGNTYEYIRLHSSFTHAAAFQAYESDAKAEQSVPTTTVTAAIATIAAYVRASRQVLTDSPQLEKYVGDLIVYGGLKKLEAELVAGTGTITGLVTGATTITATGQPADRISDAASQLIALGWNPGLVVLHPTDWHKIRTERSSSSDEYIATGWNNPATPSIWGLPVAVTPSIAVDTALVLDPVQVAILDRESPQVMVSREDATNLTSNMVTILAELRAGLAIYSPGAVGKVDLGLVA